MATLSKRQILELEQETQQYCKANGATLSEKLDYLGRFEEILLTYDNIYQTNHGTIKVRLRSGNHVDLYEII